MKRVLYAVGGVSWLVLAALVFWGAQLHWVAVMIACVVSAIALFELSRQ